MSLILLKKTRHVHNHCRTATSEQPLHQQYKQSLRGARSVADYSTSCSQTFSGSYGMEWRIRLIVPVCWGLKRCTATSGANHTHEHTAHEHSQGKHHCGDYAEFWSIYSCWHLQHLEGQVWGYSLSVGFTEHQADGSRKLQVFLDYPTMWSDNLLH